MDNRLKTFFEYTKFQIGIYTAVGTAIVGALGYDAVIADFSPGACARRGCRIALVLQAVAGYSGAFPGRET